MKSALQLGLIGLLATALYYRFARHDAGKYYLLFGAGIVVLAIRPGHLRISLRQEFNLTHHLVVGHFSITRQIGTYSAL